MKLIRCLPFLIAFCLFSATHILSAAEEKGTMVSQDMISPQTKTCIGCHSNVTPGIVQDWLTSRHARTLPGEALKQSSLEKRISADTLPEGLREYVVGCYECHSRNVDKHKDAFDHMGHRIQVVVSPNDCSTCHPVEAKQFSGSKKSYAYRNLMENPVYLTLVNTSTGLKRFENGKILNEKPSDATLHETCLGCHGTILSVKGKKTVTTKMGNIEVPDIASWPNQGVGRVNPDGSLGACTACHTRHSFSIEVARKPYTCSQCHHEPDVPAWNVYEESKHGNIYSSKGKEWNFNAVPWKVGEDMKAPTCATCHNSLLVSPSGSVLAERTHNFGSRLWVRLFGLIYSHPQPISGDTTVIKNKDGLPLPVTFTGEPAADYLIDAAEQKKRLALMSAVCSGCHGTNWTGGHFAKLENTLKETDAMTLAATQLLVQAWDKGLADKANPFDESIEQMWIRQWLFYSNSIRYASAMTGAPDYTSFKNGWWDLTENLQKLLETIAIKKEIHESD